MWQCTKSRPVGKLELRPRKHQNQYSSLRKPHQNLRTHMFSLDLVYPAPQVRTVNNVTYNFRTTLSEIRWFLCFAGPGKVSRASSHWSRWFLCPQQSVTTCSVSPTGPPKPEPTSPSSHTRKKLTDHSAAYLSTAQSKNWMSSVLGASNIGCPQ